MSLEILLWSNYYSNYSVDETCREVEVFFSGVLVFINYLHKYTKCDLHIYIYIDLWACTEGELALFKSYAIKQVIGCLTSISLAKLLFCILTDISAVSPCSSYSDSSQFKNIYILHVYVQYMSLFLISEWVSEQWDACSSLRCWCIL